jgi:hypothetical protein
MKLFRSSRNEVYVASPTTVIKPTAVQAKGATARTTLRPAPAPAPRSSAAEQPAPATAPKRSDVATRKARTPAQAAAAPRAPAFNAGFPDAQTPAAAAPGQPATVQRASHALPSARSPRAKSTDTASDEWERSPLQPLTIASHKLAIDLARSGEPVTGLSRRYPHVLNQLSAVWADLPAAAELIDDLLVDRRGGRRGFPADVLAELLTVRRIAVRRMVALTRKPPKQPPED